VSQPFSRTLARPTVCTAAMGDASFHEPKRLVTCYVHMVYPFFMPIYAHASSISTLSVLLFPSVKNHLDSAVPPWAPKLGCQASKLATSTP
jgi:hypothetical protein